MPAGRSLFLKLFLSYWAALALFAASILFAAAIYLDRTRERHDAAPFHGYSQSTRAAAQAASDAGGLEGLRKWATALDREQLVPVLVLDREGQDLLGREVSQRALAHLSRHLLWRSRPGFEGRAPVRVAGGPEYWLIPDPHGATLIRLLTRPRVLAVPLLLAALTGGIVCFVLARYLTAPLARLRAATRAYAAGDFAHRVRPSLGGRRDEIAGLATALDDMAARIGSLVESQRTLLRDVSHELRSPLARLQAAIGIARQRTGELATAELDRIEHEAERLSLLIGRVLSLARLESGIVHDRERLDLDELIDAVTADVSIEAGARGCMLRFAAHASCPMVGDPMLLHSAIDNVVTNAVRHAPGGSEVVIGLRCDRDAGQYVVDVCDSGPGVPPDMLDRIFEPFVRVDHARAPGDGGVGLGLAIARRAVLAHGGSIAAGNRPEGGLRVTIRLPVQQPAPSTAPSPPCLPDQPRRERSCSHRRAADSTAKYS